MLFTLSDIERIAALPAQDRRSIVAMAQRIRGLEVKDFQGDTLNIRAAKTKYRPRLLPYPTFIAKRLEGRKLPLIATDDSSVSKSIARATPKGFKPVGRHVLRKTAATNFEELGVRREIVEAILGHAPASMSARYSQSKLMEQKREAIEMVVKELERLVKEIKEA